MSRVLVKRSKKGKVRLDLAIRRVLGKISLGAVYPRNVAGLVGQHTEVVKSVCYLHTEQQINHETDYF